MIGCTSKLVVKQQVLQVDFSLEFPHLDCVLHKSEVAEQVLVGHLYAEGSLLSYSLYHLLYVSLSGGIEHVYGYVDSYECACKESEKIFKKQIMINNN